MTHHQPAAPLNSSKDNRYLTVFLRVSLTVIPTSWPSAIKKSISRSRATFSKSVTSRATRHPKDLKSRNDPQGTGDRHEILY